MTTIANIKNELTTTEFTSFEILVRLGDSIQLAYETVIKEKENESNKKSADNFYRNAYTN
jgi:hypothetical protein